MTARWPRLMKRRTAAEYCDGATPKVLRRSHLPQFDRRSDQALTPATFAAQSPHADRRARI